MNDTFETCTVEQRKYFARRAEAAGMRLWARINHTMGPASREYTIGLARDCEKLAHYWRTGEQT